MLVVDCFFFAAIFLFHAFLADVPVLFSSPRVPHARQEMART
jgi:hypothetical protein